MAFHWNDLAGIEATGGAVQRKYERLVSEAHGATAGSSAHLARIAFEDAWLTIPAVVKAQCEAEEEANGTAPRRRGRKPQLVEPEPEIQDEESD